MLKSEELITKVKSYNKFLNPETLTKAYNFALKAHEKQKRDEGSPYIIHPVAVANILTELKLDSATIATGLLHDTIEDTHATYSNIKEQFGIEVADLVNGVTKISEFENQAISNSKAENFRKLILATSKDIRVLLVKLADRLHNMRTIKFVLDKEKQIRKAKETMEIYAPLADRMGMNRIRDELEDLSFQVLNHEARELIKKRLDEIKENRTINFKNISFEFTDILNQNNLKSEIVGREKTPFSIWRKVQSKRVSLEQITDIIGFRIILGSIEECYKALGIFHSKYNCIPGKFKDYISSPKINGYKSIHTAVIGSFKKPIEIQIRTKEMHDFRLIGKRAMHQTVPIRITKRQFIHRVFVQTQPYGGVGSAPESESFGEVVKAFVAQGARGVTAQIHQAHGKLLLHGQLGFNGSHDTPWLERCSTPLTKGHQEHKGLPHADLLPSAPSPYTRAWISKAAEAWRSR